MSAITAGKPVAGEVVEPSRAQVLANLTGKIPLNEYGLPRYLYRTDMIPADILSKPKAIQEKILSSVALMINYNEGFPALETGHPIWETLPFEGENDYEQFKLYLKMPEKYHVRQLTLLEQVVKVPEGGLLASFHLNFWKFRAKAFDLFLTAMHEKRRLMRLMHCEDDHYVMADNLLKKCIEYFQTCDWNELDPGVVARFMPQLTEIQRRALGSGGAGASGGGSQGPMAASLELILKNVSAGTDPETSRGGDKGAASLRVLLDDPESAEMAQELIVKMQGTDPRAFQDDE